MAEGLMITHQALDAVIVGLGESGFACFQHLREQGLAVGVVDTREQPPRAPDLNAQYPDACYAFGGMDVDWLMDAQALVLSPGIDPRDPLVQRFAEQGGQITGEIELFARAVSAPVIAITGSNGKSTVTEMLAAMAAKAGIYAAAGGNLGPPALDLLRDHPQAECYILELSSFQLETTCTLKPRVAAVLNLSPDHLDRYTDMRAYANAKARILKGARHAVLNVDDAAVRSMAKTDAVVSWFSDQATGRPAGWRVQDEHDESWLCHGERRLMAASELCVLGRHNAANALAALAIGHAAGWDESAMIEALRGFTALAHRTESLGIHGGRLWVNDSKATNVASALAALQGMTETVVLLAGGQGKDQDFSALGPALADKGRAAVLFGVDAPLLADALASWVPVHIVADLKAAMVKAMAVSQPGDAVVLAPACASLDQFRDYRERGDCFCSLIMEVAND